MVQSAAMRLPKKVHGRNYGCYGPQRYGTAVSTLWHSLFPLNIHNCVTKQSLDFVSSSVIHLHVYNIVLVLVTGIDGFFWRLRLEMTGKSRAVVPKTQAPRWAESARPGENGRKTARWLDVLGKIQRTCQMFSKCHLFLLVQKFYAKNTCLCQSAFTCFEDSWPRDGKLMLW